MRKLIFVLTLLAALSFAAPTFAYTVEKGDTMLKIAQENDLTLEQLAKANPQIQDLDLILVGEHINITLEETSISYKPKKASSITYRSKKEGRFSSHSIKEESDSTKVSFSEAELDLLARIVRAEAQTEPFAGKVAVVDVVLNRVESPQFPDTVKEVIYQSGQFQPVANGQINKPADEESIEAVDAALSDMRNIAEGSLFFYNPDIATSRWLDSRETTIVIGQHVFKN